MVVDTEFELREQRPPYWSSAFVAALIAVLGGAAASAILAHEVGGSIGVRSGLGSGRMTLVQATTVLLALAAVMLPLRLGGRLLAPRLVRVEREGFRVPTVLRRRGKVVPYAAILSLQLQRVSMLRRTFLAVGFASGWPAVLSQRRWGPNGELAELRAVVLARIAQLPDGIQRRELVERRSRADARPLRLPWLSFCLVASMVAVFLVTAPGGRLRAAVTGEAAQTWGQVPGLVAQGELFRAVTANWLHVEPEHLGINAFWAVVYGWLGERVLGWQRLLVIGFASGTIAHGVSSFDRTDPLTAAVGASAWVYGWAGAGLWVRVRHGAQLPPLLQSPWVFAVLCYPLALLAREPWDPGFVHAVGFGTGIIATALLVRDGSDVVGYSRRGPAATWGAGVVLSIVIAAFVWGAANAALRSEEDSLVMLGLLLGEGHGLELPERVGWLVAAAEAAALDPAATPERMEVAERAARRAIELSRQPEWSAAMESLFPSHVEEFELEMNDVLAMALYRRGDLRGAIDREWQVVDRDPTRVYVSQAARFELAYARAHGALRMGEAPDVRVESTSNDPGRLRLTIDEPADEGLTVHAVAVHQNGAPIAHLRLVVAAPIDVADARTIELGDEDRAALEGVATFVVTRVETGIEARSDTEKGVSLRVLDSEVMDRP